MPTLREIIDGKAPRYLEFAAPSAKKSNNGEEKPDTHEMAKSVSRHITSPLEETQQGFEDLTDKRLQYDMAKEKMRRQLLPVQSVIQHVGDLHQLAQIGTHPVDPAVNNDPNMGYQDDKQGVPPNMAQEPGMMQQSRPDRNVSTPGVGPRIPTPPGGSMPESRQQKGVAPPPKGSGKMPARPGAPTAAGQRSSKKVGKMTKQGGSGKSGVTVNVHAVQAANLQPAIRNDAKTINDWMGVEKLRTASRVVRAGGPGSGV